MKCIYFALHSHSFKPLCVTMSVLELTGYSSLRYDAALHSACYYDSHIIHQD